MKYIPLNIKTEYDLMNSLIKIDELISYAKDNGIDTIGITDSNMFGTYEFINKCNQNDIKPIVGCEIIINNDNILLYARNYNGFVSLCKIVSKKNIDEIDIEYIKKLSDDLICVVDYNLYDKYKDLCTYTFIKYSNQSEKRNALSLTEYVVYMDLIRYFNESDKDYFKYIKYIEEAKTIDEEIDIYDSYFKNNSDSFDIETTRKFSSLISIEMPESKYHIPVYKENSTAYLRAVEFSLYTGI